MNETNEMLKSIAIDCVNKPFLAPTPVSQIIPDLDKTKYQPYTKLAAHTSFYQLPKYLKNGVVSAFRVIAKNGKYEYERLGYDNSIAYSDGELAGMTFYPSLHFFNLDNSINIDERTSIDLHNHLRPLGIFPMHPDGRIGEVAYRMLTEKHCPNGKSITRIHDYVRYGYPYGLDNPFLDFHSVSTSGPIISHVMGRDKNGPVNPRESSIRLEKTPERKNDLIELALNAHERTMESFDRRDEKLLAEFF